MKKRRVDDQPSLPQLSSSLLRAVVACLEFKDFVRLCCTWSVFHHLDWNQQWRQWVRQHFLPLAREASVDDIHRFAVPLQLTADQRAHFTNVSWRQVMKEKVERCRLKHLAPVCGALCDKDLVTSLEYNDLTMLQQETDQWKLTMRHRKEFHAALLRRHGLDPATAATWVRTVYIRSDKKTSLGEKAIEFDWVGLFGVTLAFHLSYSLEHTLVNCVRPFRIRLIHYRMHHVGADERIHADRGMWKAVTAMLGLPSVPADIEPLALFCELLTNYKIPGL
jgi:hypothetical protein